MAYTNLTVENFTLSDSLVFTEKYLPSQQDDNAFYQVQYSSSFNQNGLNLHQKISLRLAYCLYMFLSCPISKNYKQYLANFPSDL